MDQHELDLWHMRRALELAERGQGRVEPNPMVGCVIAAGAEIIGEGWHRQFGGPHAEVEALAVAGPRARGATMHVTLEPCCHQGKTPPCTRAVIEAGLRRVVLAQRDPFPQVAGGGLAELQAAGVEVEVGLLESDARRLNAPYLKLLDTGRPWVIAKWAMTLDGKLATRTGSSRWISCAESREIAHGLRGRVDAILVGARTARHDDPLLTARTKGSGVFVQHDAGSAPQQRLPTPFARTATRVVLDTRASLASESQLVRTAREVPVLVAAGREAPASERERLEAAGCEVFVCQGKTHPERLGELLDELGRRRMTNILVEGGSHLLGSLLDAAQIDEVHVFIAPKLAGGQSALSPIAGEGLARMFDAMAIDATEWKQVGTDVYLCGRVRRAADPVQLTNQGDRHEQF
jgi:diaminohydroxyphosphoribosylaminopyrimidine deaminase/5-amino-6-(5-phosphoribosylamino)uracil reductase